MSNSESSPIPATMRQRVVDYITQLQNTIVRALEDASDPPCQFKRDTWSRPQGGGGISCTYASSGDDATYEKAGVNISMIHGTLPPAAIKQMSSEHSSLDVNPMAALPFFAGGISLIVHPRNPNAPSAHANYRYFEVMDSTEKDAKVVGWWFGGITDLTPSYLFEEDAREFHGTLKAVCDAYGTALYPKFKQSCDDHFFIPHRKEYRGIGGIRFDDLNDEMNTILGSVDHEARPRTADDIFAFVRALGDAFTSSYMGILNRRKTMLSDERMRRWQLLRRGRYVEFNLVCERGIKFGLAAPGVNVENVLMGMPETARWEYMSEMFEESDSAEGKMMEVLKFPKSWIRGC
ncbi:coproporphyrinogen III oxidase [Suillus clintonianus]|uniref:coproporphyrinogen III oxidase n=1 Tax=Suillus clintonianus TaxID=1904413 RepID=UPI001B8729B5|nr:coproporphyrinogen III oxidase [Suillus clintonianus]KAG2137971.1 coproporphyrinogen III oxidase [Suillus clintonianus]